MITPCSSLRLPCYGTVDRRDCWVYDFHLLGNCAHWDVQHAASGKLETDTQTVVCLLNTPDRLAFCCLKFDFDAISIKHQVANTNVGTISINHWSWPFPDLILLVKG